MKFSVFSIYDRAAQAYGRPFVAPHVGIAMREFEDVVNNDKSDLFRHPDDYSLFEIGIFDDSSAELEASKPKQLATARQIFRSSVPDSQIKAVK